MNNTTEFDPTLEWLLLDAGRALLKAMCTRDDVLEWCTHAQAEIDRAKYNMLKQRYVSQGIDGYDTVAIDGRYYVIGEAAYAQGVKVQKRQDLTKYESDYMRPIVVSMLLRLFEGNIPPVLNCMIGHAPKDFENVAMVTDSVFGNYAYEYPNGKGRFRIAYVMPCDEIVGAAMNVALNTYGQPYDKKANAILSGTNLVFDWGGDTLDMLYTKNGIPQYAPRPFSESMGGNKQIEVYRALVAQDHKAIVARAKDRQFPFEAAQRSLLNDKYTHEHLGDVYDLSPQFKEAFAPLLHTMRDYVYDYTNGFIGVENVLIAGGVSDMLYGRLIETGSKNTHEGIFYPFTTQGGKKKERTFRVDKRGEMFAGVVRGFRRLAFAQIADMKGSKKHARG